MIDIPSTAGVKKLKESPSGRRLIERIQKEHEIELLQPSDVRFENVYGTQTKRSRQIYEQQVRESNDLWKEKEDKESFQKRREIGTKKFF